MHDQINAIVEGREFKPNLPPFLAGQFKNGSFIYYYYDLYITSSLLLYGEWAQLEIDFLCQFLASGDTVVDAGAFIGTHTIPFARVVGSTGTVFSFEPTLESFYCLSGNIVLNNLYKVKAFNLALGSKKQKIEIPEPTISQITNFGASGNLGRLDMQVPIENVRKVDAITLDSLKIKECKLLKIDAEHMELDVLKGAAKTIKRCAPFILAETPPAAKFNKKSNKYHKFQDDTLEMLEFMSEFDYVPYYFISSLYNPSNFYSNSNNIFGHTASIALFFCPKKYTADFQAGVNYLQRLD